jgi:hypothetical protein
MSAVPDDLRHLKASDCRQRHVFFSGRVYDRAGGRSEVEDKWR